LVPFWAGAVAGTAQSIVACPIDNLKHRFDVRELVLGRSEGNAWRYVWDEARLLGAKRLYRGFWRSTARDAIGFGMFFGVFETAKGQLLPRLDWMQHRRLERGCSAAVGGISAALAFHGTTTVLQHALRGETRRTTLRLSLSRVYRDIGRNFYRSLLPTAVALISYELMLPDHIHSFYSN
jgi:hypothetical protein